MFTLFVALLYISTMIYLANLEVIHQKKQPITTMLQYGLVVLVVFWILNALIFIIVPPEQVTDPALAEQIEQVNPTIAIGFIGLGLISVGLLIYMIRSNRIYHQIENIFYRKLSDKSPTYNPTSRVHQLAIMLMIVQSLAIVWTLMVSGGLEGLDYTFNSIIDALLELATGGIMYLVVALTGVGWLVRRDTRSMLKRLGLRFPTRQDWSWGIGGALLIYLISQIFSALWIAVTPVEIIEQQTIASQQLFELFSGSLILGFILAVITGVSEEILFRGALQPVFGLLISSLFFTILHIQYALTPATLILFVVSLGFGWLRQHASTTASIIAHSTYNFIPFLLFSLATQTGAI